MFYNNPHPFFRNYSRQVCIPTTWHYWKLTFYSCYVEPIVLVHGGADNVHSLRIEQRKDGIKKAAMSGYKLLKKGGSVTDAVEAAVRVMEEDQHFNAGL